MTTISGETISNPTAVLKGIDTGDVPEVDYLNESDFKRFVYTGIRVDIDLPLVKNTKSSLFGINIDGFIPPYNMADGVVSNFLMNLFPVQVFRTSMSTVHITQEQIELPIQSMYASHRYISGNVGVGLRVTSNTTQPGNFIISQASGMVRNYYDGSTAYRGLEWVNGSTYTSDYSIGNFVLADTSLNRNISITPVRKDQLKVCDLAQKLNMLQQSITTKSFNGDMPWCNQFAEDWLMFSPLSDFPNNNGNKLTISIFFDYSKVNFEVPMYMIIAEPRFSAAANILNVSGTIDEKTSNEIARADWVFLAP